MKSALLLSGGLESTAIAAWLRPQFTITVDYGQLSAEGEIRAAQQIAVELDLHHEVIRVNCAALGSGDLAGLAPNSLAPATEWWPFRNQLLITLAAMAMIRLGANRLLFGSVKGDSFHMDGTSEFFERMNTLCHIQEGQITVEAPAVHMTSVELIKRSEIKPALLAWAHSCHTSAWACGLCRGCCKHRLVMQELGCDPY